MAKELIVSVNGREKKIAIIENDQVTEFYIERGEENQGIVGNIYKGRVMRVLPGMQSAFVDVGLERDAFLYVSDFFDEEEEFERIVIDKAKQGEPDAGKIAAEQIALSRVEREHHIEATQERAEPLREAEPILPPEETVDGGDPARRRSRRGGRRRGRGKDSTVETSRAGSAPLPEEDESETPLALPDPSIQRIVDDEETATNGEMFKDARLQERIFDQIHAVEFNFEDDFRTAEVGSILPTSGYRDDAFQRVADDEDSEAPQIMMRAPAPIEAHVSSFVDSTPESTLNSGSFQRISDDEELITYLPVPEPEEDLEEEVEPEKHGFAERVVEKIVSVAKGKRATKKSPTSRTTKPRAASKKAAPRKTVAEEVADDSAELASSATADETFEDTEARITGSRSRGEFATRRGGRRRRRPTSKKAAGEATNEVEEQTEGAEQPATEAVEALEPQAVPEPAAAAEPAPRERSQDKRGPRGGGGGGRRDRQQQPTITDLLDEGQEILVQIAKEPIAKKGARITSHIALPGRFLVYMPTVEHVGVSRKIESDSERHRLRKLIQILRAEEDVPSGGFIVRTAGVGISEKDLREDVRYLVRTWLDIRAAAEKAKPASLVHRDLDLVQRILRDQLSDDFAAIRVDSEEEYESVVEFVNRIQPRMVNRVKLYTREQPILEAFGVQAEIDKAIKPRVWLKSGGYLVINQTEALVAIDVNTGKFVGRGGSGRLEDTITRTNLEAVEEIVRQIRLRDLGGIIVLDLIDMEERRNRTKVMQVLQDALRGDKSPTKVLSFNDFGLVIMTRKRVKQSLERTLCAPCQYCQGAGLIKSPQTVCYELLEEARRLGKHMNGSRKNKQATLRVNPEVARALRGAERDVLNEIEEYLGPVDINSDQAIHQEQFDFAFI